VASDEFIFNDQYYSLHHTTAEQMGGYRMHAADFAQRLVHPDDAKLVGESIQKALNSLTPDFFDQTEARILCSDGEMRWVQVRFKIEKDARGATIRLIGANQDITEHKDAEKNQQRLNRALKLLSDCNMALVHAVEESICCLKFAVWSLNKAAIAWHGLALPSTMRRSQCVQLRNSVIIMIIWVVCGYAGRIRYTGKDRRHCDQNGEDRH